MQNIDSGAFNPVLNIVYIFYYMRIIFKNFFLLCLISVEEWSPSKTTWNVFSACMYVI